VRATQLKEEYEVEVKWLAFPLHPETPEEGVTFEQLFAGRGADISGMSQRLKQVAETLHLPLAGRTRIYNTRLAQELGKWAESEGRGDAFHEAAFKAYFVEDKNIAKMDELMSLAVSVGLPGDVARDVLLERTYREAVDADWKRSRALGVTGVPTFIIADKRIVGFQPYSVLERFLKDCGVTKR
jgi:predicted DsbA family dithiol-disulfide isomerase